MARRILLDTQYTFTPSTRTIVLPRALLRERLLLITNLTTNTVIYNFSDPTLTATSFTITPNTMQINTTTSIVLTYNTTAMSSTDKLQIMIDEPSEFMVPDESYQDAVGKMRISQPQALIDTDFEYGLQPTKWETIGLVGNRPSFYINTQNPLNITNITAFAGNGNVIVNFSGGGLTNFTPILVQDSSWSGANGAKIVLTTDGSTFFSFNARTVYTGTTGSVFNANVTQIYQGAFYTSAAYQLLYQPTYANNLITVTTVEAHNLQVGDGIYVTSANIGQVNGAWQVTSVPTANTFTYIGQGVFNTYAAPGSAIASAVVYPRPDADYRHRAFDGGVQFSTGTPAHAAQIVRQTRRYFRYQSGKGIQISTGTLLKPQINLDGLTANGTTIIATTKIAHNLNAGAAIIVTGANETAYNGTWVVDQIIDPNRFTYIANTVPSASPASGIIQLSVSTWYGSTVRLGMFDFQNGFFFEYDGQNLYTVQRRSIDQLSGAVNVVNGNALVYSANVNGQLTKFSQQLTTGDFVVIRGAHYTVQDILSDQLLRISPPYRGLSQIGANTVVVSKTIDLRTPQTLWNMDKCDGTGPSGLTLDLTKMQMFYMDYSWYGSGTIRWGFRDTQGKIIYCHRQVNSNNNYEAYMRSGNLPARYEVNTFNLRTNLAANLGIGATTMTLGNVINWPSQGTVLVADPNIASGYEYINYSGIYYGNATLVGLTRAPNLAAGFTTISTVTTTIDSANVTTASSVASLQVGMQVQGQSIQPDSYIAGIFIGGTNTIKLTRAANATTSGVTLNAYNQGANTAAHNASTGSPIGVYLQSPSFSPTISHWGTSVIMDGRYDDDKSLIFVYGENSLANVAPGANCALMTVRISPSVDSGVPGLFGQREITNRMQMILRQVEVLVSGSFIVSLVLNGNIAAGTNNTSGTATAGTYQRVATGTSSLTQVADHLANVNVIGGESMFGFYAVNTAGAGNFSVYTQDLSLVRDIGNSILGGAVTGNPQLNIYPDGPDTVTVVAQNIGNSFANVSARLSWSEAQA